MGLPPGITVDLLVLSPWLELLYENMFCSNKNDIIDGTVKKSMNNEILKRSENLYMLSEQDYSCIFTKKIQLKKF